MVARWRKIRRLASVWSSLERSSPQIPQSRVECDDPTPPRVTLLPSGWQFDAPPDTPILLAAQAAGIKLPSLCRNGTCRACLCEARSGERGERGDALGTPAPVTYRIEWPGLSRDEKMQGWLLPCCAYACADLVIDAPDAVRAAL
ncbi:ferredoxin [Pandoraea sputorum]|nr:ferredoxin [Pandoraea sputorum]